MQYSEFLKKAEATVPSLRNLFTAMKGEFGNIIEISPPEMLRKVALEMFIYGSKDIEFSHFVREKLLQLREKGVLTWSDASDAGE